MPLKLSELKQRNKQRGGQVGGLLAAGVGDTKPVCIAALVLEDKIQQHWLNLGD